MDKFKGRRMIIFLLLMAIAGAAFAPAIVTEEPVLHEDIISSEPVAEEEPDCCDNHFSFNESGIVVPFNDWVDPGLSDAFCGGGGTIVNANMPSGYHSGGVNCTAGHGTTGIVWTWAASGTVASPPPANAFRRVGHTPRPSASRWTTRQFVGMGGGGMRSYLRCLRWNINEYTVNFELNGGNRSGGGELSQRVSHGATVDAPEITREGHRFIGWDRSLTIVNDLQNNATVTINAEWIQQHTVRFENYNGEHLITETVDCGSEASAPELPTRYGHTFAQWDTPLTNIRESLTVTAEFTPDPFDVIFQDYDDTELRRVTIPFGTAATPPNDPTRYGHSFTGWNPADFTVKTAQNLFITAQYVPSLFDIIFLNYDGTVFNKQEVGFGSSGAFPNVEPEKYGHTFRQWYTDDLTIASESNKIIRPIFDINEYTVVFTNWNKVVLSSQAVTHGSKATAPIVPSREGYSFTGWDCDFSYISSDLAVTATYSPLPQNDSGGGGSDESSGDESSRDEGSSGGGGNSEGNNDEGSNIRNSIENGNNAICEDCNMFLERCICCDNPDCESRRGCDHCGMCEYHCSCEDTMPLATIGEDGTRIIAAGTTPPGTPPLFSLMGRNIYLFAPLHLASWSIINFLLTLLGAVLVIFKLLQKKRTEKPEESRRHKKKWLIPASIFGAIAVLLLIILQDIAALTALLDTWTIAHMAIFIIQIICIKAYNGWSGVDEDRHRQEVPDVA